MVRDNFKKTFITIYKWYRALTADGWAQWVHSSESAGSKVLSHSWHGEPKKSHQKHRSSWSYREEWWLYRIKLWWNPGKKGDVNQQRWDLDRWSIANRLLKMQHGNETPFLPGKPSANGCAWGIYYHIWQMFPMQWSHGFGLQSLMFPGFGQGFHLKLRF